MQQNKPNLVVFDLDSTLTMKDTYLDFLSRFLLAHPSRLVRTIALPFDVARFKLGQRNNSWLKQRFLSAILAGVSRAELEAFSRRFVDGLWVRGMRQSALSRLAEHRESGDRIVLVTASFDFYVRYLAQKLGIEEVVATGAQWRDDRLTGKLAGQNCYGVEKLRRLDALLGDQRDSYKVITYSDHHSDEPLLAWADEAVAVAPSASLAATAHRKGWQIIPE
ncbi:MAG: HAD-IB family hydrolase [Gammaproteobacteria bacterium]|nr:MAG: HAD-IB family hydrolase [Gammaproteobacteria bacterium]